MEAADVNLTDRLIGARRTLVCVTLVAVLVGGASWACNQAPITAQAEPPIAVGRFQIIRNTSDGDTIDLTPTGTFRYFLLDTATGETKVLHEQRIEQNRTLKLGWVPLEDLEWTYGNQSPARNR